jgi:hypothetical protein
LPTFGIVIIGTKHFSRSTSQASGEETHSSDRKLKNLGFGFELLRVEMLCFVIIIRI